MQNDYWAFGHRIHFPFSIFHFPPSGLMRVIAGSAKGRRLVAPKGRKIRPTADRIKESLFNIIAGRIDGAAVLDLFAGGGALAIEALSRGAVSAILVDFDKAAIGIIKRNLASTDFIESAAVIHSQAVTALDRLIAEGQALDLIFLDPPYKIAEDKLEIVLTKTAKCLSRRGQVILEHKSNLSDLKLKDMILTDKRQYGDTNLSFYEKREN